MATSTPLLAFLLLLVTTAFAIQPVAVRLRGNFGTAPATVVVIARVEPRPENRDIEACVVGDYTACSARAHVGVDAPIQVVFEPFRGLPQGEYDAVVTVRRQSVDGRWTTAVDKQHFIILEAFGG